ncbi:MAG TPA: hypothetical protein VMP12_07910 [Candidatus Sulfotelmatobacter sp.]|nr:hypothetical protein [Candidatus Sulfotelmatobacter sp.]
MRNAFALFASSVLVVVAAALPGRPAPVPQTHLSITDIYSHPFEIDLPYDQKLALDLRSGDYHVVGSAAEKLSVRTTGDRAEKGREVSLSFKHMNSHAELKLTGGPTSNGPSIVIEVPKASNLVVRLPFGDLNIEGVSGDKDVEMHAGDLNIEVGNPADYGHVDASVGAGDLSAGPFGESKDGLFRSFEKSGTGRYRLHAHVGAGDLNLR